MDQQNHKLKLSISEVILILLYSSMIIFHHETLNVVSKKSHIDGKLHFEKLNSAHLCLLLYVLYAFYSFNFHCGRLWLICRFNWSISFYPLYYISYYYSNLCIYYYQDLLIPVGSSVYFLFLLDLFIASPNSAVFNCQPAIRHFQKKGLQAMFSCSIFINSITTQ